MAILKQSTNLKNCVLFYGSCDLECEDFDLIPHSDFFNSVYQFSEVLDLLVGLNQGVSFFTSLSCGKLYYVTLNTKANELDIPHAMITKFEDVDNDYRFV